MTRARLRDRSRLSPSLLLVLVLLALSPACDPPSEPQTSRREVPRQSEPAPSLATEDPNVLRESPESVALAWCRYTQGPVPHWLLHAEMAPLVVPRERALLTELGAETEAAAYRFLVHERAVMRFLERNTRCRVTSSRELGPDTVQVAVMQEVPLMVDPRERVALPEAAPLEEREAAWLAALERAFEGQYNAQPFALTAERHEGQWYIDPALESRFGAPRRADKALRTARVAVEARDWEAAARSLDEGCAITPADVRCTTLSETVERAPPAPRGRGTAGCRRRSAVRSRCGCATSWYRRSVRIRRRPRRGRGTITRTTSRHSPAPTS